MREAIMTRTATLLLLIACCLARGSLVGQGLDPALLTKPATDAWPTYAGDYSQRRYSTLAQIDTTNVRHLSLAWVSRLTAGAGGGEGGFFAPPPPPTVTGGVAENPVNIPGSTSGSPRLSGSILQVNGILYISSPDNAWAVDALDGHVLWHYWWKSRGGIHIGNRGMAMYGDWLYFETPDDYLVSLDAKTGQERWHKEIADFSQQYFSTTAPVVVGDHVLVGTGDDLDAPGFLQSLDPKTCDPQWKFYTVPMKASSNGYVFVLDRTNGKHLLTAKYSDAANWAETVSAQGQPVRNAAKDNTVAGSLVSPDNGGATNWNPPSYDPRTGLLYVVLREIYAMYYLTNKDPRMLVGLGGSEQDVVGSLGTSIVAIDYQNGKLAWKYRLTGGSGTGLLTTAGGLLFANDGSGSLVAFGLRGRRSPVPLWHAQIGSIEKAPGTHTPDGRPDRRGGAGGRVSARCLALRSRI